MSDEFVMPHGQYKGKPLSEVPMEYLVWAVSCRQVSPDIAARMVQEVKERDPELHARLSGK